MSKGFEGARGRATVSVIQPFVEDEGGTLAVSFPGWHHAIEVYAHAADEGMAIGEANAALVAEAFNTHESTGLTPRQLAEQRAELLGALRRIANHNGNPATPVANSVKKSAIARAAIEKANATQQRKGQE